MQQLLQAEPDVPLAVFVPQGTVRIGMELSGTHRDPGGQRRMFLLHFFQHSHSQREFDDAEQREGRIHVDTGTETVFGEQGHTGQGFFVPHQGMDVPFQRKGVHGGLRRSGQSFGGPEGQGGEKQGQGEQKDREDA